MLRNGRRDSSRIQEVCTRSLLLGGLGLADNELARSSVIVIERVQTNKTVQQLGVRLSVNCNDQLITHLLLCSFFYGTVKKQMV